MPYRLTEMKWEQLTFRSQKSFVIISKVNCDDLCNQQTGGTQARNQDFFNGKRADRICFFI